MAVIIDFRIKCVTKKNRNLFVKHHVTINPINWSSVKPQGHLTKLNVSKN